MDQYAARFQNPQYPAGPTNLVAATPTQGPQARPMAQPGSPAGNLPNPAAMSAQPAAPRGTPVGDADVDSDTSFESLFRKMPEKEQDHHVDQLERQVGDINRAYDQMQQQLGQRPDTKLTRREKGMLIMEFGLQLMSQSGATKSGGNLGGAIGDAGVNTIGSYRDLMKEKRGEQQTYDTQQRNLTAGRFRDLHQAQADAQRAEREDRLDANAQARADEQARHNQVMEEQGATRLSNLEDWRATQVEKGVGAGRPAASGGRGGGKPTANIQNINDLVSRGVPEELAMRIVYRQIKDPRDAWRALYDARRKTFSTEAEATQEADEIIGRLYGRDALRGARAPLVQQAKPTTEVVPISGDEEYAKLPSGQRFKGPDGVIRRKP